MDPRMNKNGEYNWAERGGRMPNRPGVYYHPQADKFVETAGQRRPDGTVAYAEEEGKIQADAFVQMGYRLATDEELVVYQERLKLEENRKALTEATEKELSKKGK